MHSNRRKFIYNAALGLMVPFVPKVVAGPYLMNRRNAFRTASSPTWVDALTLAATDTDNALNEYAQSQPIVATQSGSCTALRLYANYINNETTDLKMALYDASQNLLASGNTDNVPSSGAPKWVDVTIAGTAVTSGTTYWVSSIISASGGIIGRYLDSQPSGTSRIEFGTSYAGYPPDPFPTGDWTKKLLVGMYIS